MDEISPKGYLKVILGPMFSGKTTELIRIFKRYSSCDKIKCCVINHKDDTRYDKTLMSSHSKEMIKAYNFKTLSELFNNNLHYNYDIFLINEGQFFDDLYDAVDLLVNKFNKKLYICGLDGDYQRKKFGKLLDIIPLCDDVVKLKSICKNCNVRDGIFTHRLSDEKQQKLVGVSNYIPLCRLCYTQLNKIHYSQSKVISPNDIQMF